MNSNELDWELIQSFHAALEHGSLLGAAKATGVSQPTLGRHIAALEAQLKVALFERTGRGLTPTPAAHKLADAAGAMREGADRLWRLAQSQDTADTGRVRITATQSVGCFVLPAVLREMKNALPDIVVELVVSNSVDNLLRRDADIAIRMVRPQQDALIARRIGRMAIRACAHRSYLQERGVPASPADLWQHDLVTGDRSGEVEKGAAQLQMPMDRVRFGLRSDDLVAQWKAVRAGLGIGFVAEPVMTQDPDVVPVLPEMRLPEFPVWLAVHREIRTTARFRAVYDFLGHALGEVLC
ncbi:LysR family transcriptional regulator [Hydrogenophaga sp. 5NK40-0174]|uniref:LysR family transcriptional regulator n=1 Tax=Hydrogenophaga sp. 5NK40-0174 TaxID=3127649 RepID=UPI0031073B15